MESYKPLNDAEKGKMQANHDQGHSSRFIARKVGRSPTAVLHYLQHLDNYGKNMKHCSVIALSPQNRLNIIRITSNSGLSASKIKEKTGVSASVQTVRRTIDKAKHRTRLK